MKTHKELTKRFAKKLKTEVIKQFSQSSEEEALEISIDILEWISPQDNVVLIGARQILEDRLMILNKQT